MACEHERWEQIAAADGGDPGGCPICMSAEIDRLNALLAQAEQAARDNEADAGALTAEIVRLKGEIQNAAYEQQLDANAAVAANDAAAKFQAENDELRKALREVINRAVLETGTTWKDTANDMANIAHAALMPF